MTLKKSVKNYSLHPELGFLTIFCTMYSFGSQMEPMNSFKECFYCKIKYLRLKRKPNTDTKILKELCDTVI